MKTKNTPTTKNSTRLFLAGLVGYLVTFIIYQFIEGFHFAALSYFEKFLMSCFSCVMGIAIGLRLLALEEIIATLRKRISRQGERLLRLQISADGFKDTSARWYEIAKDREQQIKKLNIEVEQSKGWSKVQQMRASEAINFSQAMELVNSQLIDNQKNLQQTINQQDKTIKGLMKINLASLDKINEDIVLHATANPEINIPYVKD